MNGLALALVLLAPPAVHQKIIASARDQTTWGTIYDPAYVRLKYPGGDVPRTRGVCSDVIVRALRTVGRDLQVLIHEDKKARPRAYPKYPGQKGPDRNIDHRRVKNMVVFFRKFGRELPTRTFAPGDFVTWKLAGGLDHIGIVTDRKGPSRNWMVVHNLGGTREEDVLEAWTIVGRYRYP